MDKLNNLVLVASGFLILILTFNLSDIKPTDSLTEELSQSSEVSEPKGKSESGERTYCTALRGNGEVIASHWLSLARIIETKKQIPIGGSGGSSASLTLFILDTLMKSPLVYDDGVYELTQVNKDSLRILQQKVNYKKFAFLLKMIPQQFNYALKWKKGQYLQLLALQQYLAGQSEEESGDDAALSKDNPTEAERIKLFKLIGQIKKVRKDAHNILDDHYLQYEDKLTSLFDGVTSLSKLRNFKKNSGQDFKELKYLIANFKESFKYFSSFDAENDVNLFFRPGLVDFGKLGRILNNTLALYVHKDLKNSEKNKWAKNFKNFVDKCSVVAENKVWFDDSHWKQSSCVKGFKKVLKNFYDNGLWKSAENNMFTSDIGSHISAVVTTSVLTQPESIKKVKEIQKAYNEQSDSKDELIKNFSVDFDSELSFGYWYNQSYKSEKVSLEEKMQSLDDIKSSKFLNLGRGKWSDALSTSPAEPGLTNMRPVKTMQGDILSAGGWSDLHPVLVLNNLYDNENKKICDDVVYITRRNGESNFNQKVVLRLLGLKDTTKIEKEKSCNFKRKKYSDKVEDKLNEKLKSIREKNSDLVFHWTVLLNYNSDRCIEVSDQTLASTVWGQMSYWWNPLSSIRRSTNAADEVYCTNWDDFNVVGGELPLLLHDAYHSALWKKKGQEMKTTRVGCW